MGQSTDAILFYGYCWFDERSDLAWERALGHNEEKVDR
jgi:hypothetical protein